MGALHALKGCILWLGREGCSPQCMCSSSCDAVMGESTDLYPFLSSVSVSGPIGFTLKSQNTRDVIFKQ